MRLLENDTDSPTLVRGTDEVSGLTSPAEEASQTSRTRSLLVLRTLAARRAWTDALCVWGALSLTHLMRFGDRALTIDYALIFLTAPVIWILVFRAFGLYAPHRLTGWEELRRLVSASFVGVVAVMLGSFWSESLFSRDWVGPMVLFGLAFELTSRYLWRHFTKRMQSDGRLAMRTLVIGGRERSQRLFEDLKSTGSGFLPIAHLDVEARHIADDSVSPGERARLLREAIRTVHADCVFVDSAAVDYPLMLSLVQAARQEGVELRMYAPLTGVLSTRLTLQALGSTGMALALQPVSLSTAQRVFKRVFDVTISSVCLLVLSPLLAAVALLIRLTSSGPVFYRQERVTQGGRSFRIFKYRTMTTQPSPLAMGNDTATPFFKLKDDPRLTPAGRFLRRLSLDELPQLLNVVRGEMSLVGPRPLPAEQVSAHPEMLGARHEVRAGVTGWWQIQGRSEIPPEEAVRLDHFYIENWSPMLDLYILARTVWILITRRGAY